MTDPQPQPTTLVKITKADALVIRGELKEINHGLARVLGALMRAPFTSTLRAADVEAGAKSLDALIDRLTIAIHESEKLG